MFAETENVDYRLSLAGQGKLTSVFSVPYKYIPKTVLYILYICKGNKRPFSRFRINIYRKRYSIYYIYVYINIYLYMFTCMYAYTCIHIHTAVSNGKRKPRRFSLIRLPFAHCRNGSLFFVRLLAKKQMSRLSKWTGGIGPWSVFKSTRFTAPKKPLSNGFDLGGFEKLQQIQKRLGLNC
jgi:hypothetical protein